MSDHCNLPNCGVPIPHGHGTDSDIPTSINCHHRQVSRTMDSTWECDTCGDKFIPASDLETVAKMNSGLAQEQSSLRGAYDIALDGIAAIQEAVLWGVIERAVERYGKDVVPDLDEPQHEDPDRSPFLDRDQHKGSV